MNLSLCTVGTGTVTPHPRRCSAAHVVTTKGGEGRGRSGMGGDGKGDETGLTLLMDCGAGTVHGLARHGIDWKNLTHVAITHFHADHLGELPALIFAMKYGALEPRTAPLPLIGPAGLRHRLAGFAQALGEWVSEPGFPLDLHEIAPGETVSLVSGVTLSACKTPHTDESLAFAVATPGARLVYTGDTGPSDALGDWAAGCEALLAECSLPEHMAMGIHLTPRGAGALAHRAQAKRLILTHLYPPVETVDIPGLVGEMYDGPVVVAQDGERFEIG